MDGDDDDGWMDGWMDGCLCQVDDIAIHASPITKQTNAPELTRQKIIFAGRMLQLGGLWSCYYAINRTFPQRELNARSGNKHKDGVTLWRSWQWLWRHHEPGG